MPAVPAPDPSKAVGEDATLEVGSEIPFHPGGNRVPEKVLVGGCGKEGLKVVLDDGVEWSGRGAAWAVDGARWRCRGSRRAVDGRPRWPPPGGGAEPWDTPRPGPRHHPQAHHRPAPPGREAGKPDRPPNPACPEERGSLHCWLRARPPPRSLPYPRGDPRARKHESQPGGGVPGAARGLRGRSPHRRITSLSTRHDLHPSPGRDRRSERRSRARGTVKPTPSVH